MKKLLTILVLALALCLVCGAALADEYAGSFTLFKADGVTPIDTEPTTVPFDFTNAKGDSVSLDPYTMTPTLAEVVANKAKHTDFQRVVINGWDNVLNEYYPEVYIYVKVNADHDWQLDPTDARNKPSTCSAKGVAVYKCSVCGITKTEDVDMLSHTYVRTNTSTCLAEGKYVYRCSKCGEDLKAGGKVVEEPLDIVYNADDYHKYSLIVIAPSCTTKSTTVDNGKAYFQCSVCKKIYDLDFSADADLEAVYEAAFGGWAPDGPVDGVEEIDIYEYQQYCGDDDFDGHTWSEWYDHEDATCFHEEQHKKRCKICGLTYALPVDGGDPILDPVWVMDPAATCATVVGDPEAQFICALCMSLAPAHPAVPVDHLDDTTYPDRVMFYDDGTFDLMRVIFHKGKLEKTVYYDPVTTNEYDALKDVPDADKKDGTFCTDYKIRSKYKCTVCSTKYDVDKDNDHTWEAWEKINDGSPVDKWTRKCKICNKVETTTVNPGNPPCAEHTWVADEGQTIVCGKNANIKQTCSVCGAKQTAEWERKDEWKVIGTVTPATCTEKGVALAVCTYEGCKNIDYPEIEATGHKPVAVAEVPATCKDAGTKAGFKCENCGKFLDANKADANVIDALEVIPADEKLHVPSELLAEVKPTCTAEGKKVYTCTVCGKTITEVVEKLPHTWDEGVVTKEATKEAKGEKTFTCTVCGETKTEPIDWAPAEPAKYTMTASYDGNTVTGKLVHDDTTVEADVKNIRVTFYIEGNYYMATMAEVAADGTFSVDGVGPIVYITVAATGNTSVNPEDYQKIAEPVEIFVK